MPLTDEITIEWWADDLNRIHVYRDGDWIFYEESQPENEQKKPVIGEQRRDTSFRYLLRRFVVGEGPGLLGEYWSYPGTTHSGLAEWEAKLIPYFMNQPAFQMFLSLDDWHLEIIASKISDRSFHEQTLNLARGLDILGHGIGLMWCIEHYGLAKDLGFWENLLARIEEDEQHVVAERKFDEEEREQLKLIHKDFISSAGWDRASTSVRHVSTPLMVEKSIADYVIDYIEKTSHYPKGEHLVTYGKGNRTLSVLFLHQKLPTEKRRYQDLIRLGRKIMKEADIEEALNDEELIDLCFEEARDGETVYSMSWSGGSWAYVSLYEGFFWGFDEAERYGPFDSFEDAICIGPDFSDDFDEIDSSWTHEDHR